MFGLASGVYQSYFAPPKLSILIVGLDGSGKTALLERIKVTNISTQLDVTASSLPPSYPTGAVLVSGRTDDFVADGAVGNNNNGRKHKAGTPARLPPPLPSKKATKGRKFVDKVTGSSSSTEINNNLEGGTTITSSSRNGHDEVESKINEAARLFISSDVPPPPFDMSENITSSRPPLPTNNNVKRKNVTSAHQNDNNMRSSLRNMLRCPSPQKYTMAAMGGEEEDEYLDEHDVAESSTVSSQSNNDEDNVNGKLEDEDYLKDYHIDYNETQQFDIKNSKAKMFPLDKIRPTLGQNLAKLDMCGCKCSIFDLSGAEKMRPLWERYYRDADAIVYVVNCADTSLDNLEKSRSEFQQMCQNDVIERHCRAGLPILIFANQIDLAYREYGEATAVNESNDNTNGIKNSWNADEEDDFVGGPGRLDSIPLDETDTNAGRALEFHDLAALFGLHDIENNKNIPNLLLFGGSAKSGEGVRASMEVLMAHAKKYHLGRRK